MGAEPPSKTFLDRSFSKWPEVSVPSTRCFVFCVPFLACANSFKTHGKNRDVFAGKAKRESKSMATLSGCTSLVYEKICVLRELVLATVIFAPGARRT